MRNRNFILVTMIIMAGAIFRLVPHPPNFTPIGAMALLGAMYYGRKLLAFIVPLAALFLSDLILNNTINRMYFTDQAGPVVFNDYMIPVYIAFIVTGFIGLALSSSSVMKKIIGGAVGASIAFFVITNFGTWLASPLYPRNAIGLMECYVAAIPFFGNTLLSNLIFISAFIAAYEGARQYVLKPAHSG